MINIKRIKPVFNRIVTTADTYSGDTMQNGIIVHTSGSLKEFQKVIAVGDSVRAVKPGDLVCVNPSRYAVKKYEENSIRNDLDMNKVIRYNFTLLELDKVPHLLLFDSDIDYVVTDYVDEEEPIIQIPEKKVIV